MEYNSESYWEQVLHCFLSHTNRQLWTGLARYLCRRRCGSEIAETKFTHLNDRNDSRNEPYGVLMWRGLLTCYRGVKHSWIIGYRKFIPDPKVNAIIMEVSL